MRREEIMAAELIAKDRAMKAKAAKNAQNLTIGGARKPSPSLFSASGIVVILLLLAFVGTFVAMLMKTAA